MFLKGYEPFWQLRIANAVSVEVDYAKTHSVFQFTCAKVVQEWLPVAVLFQVFRHMLGKQDVTGIAAIHDPLSHVNSSPGNI